MSEADVEVIRTFHRHYERHDFDAMSQLLHPQVVWRGDEPGPACLDRSQVLDWLGHLKDHVPPLEILELVDLGDAVMVGLPGEEPWDRPTFSQRVKVRDGVMVEIQDYGPRDAALRGGPPSADSGSPP